MTRIPFFKIVEYCSWTYPHYVINDLGLLCLRKSPILIENEWVPVSLVLSLSLWWQSHLVCCYCHGQLWNIPFFLCSQCIFFTKIQNWSINVFWVSIQPGNTDIIAAILSFCSLAICLAVSILCSHLFLSHCSGLLIKHQHHGTHFFPLLTQIQVTSSHNRKHPGTHRKREERTENSLR